MNESFSTKGHETKNTQIYIPERFALRIDAHLLGNYAQIVNYPLIMCIVGDPGMGKTWQLRHHLDALGVETYSVNASKLEDEYAGRPAKYLEEIYTEASFENNESSRSAVVIDDFDTTVGEWDHNTGTVNHQMIIAFLMHVAENSLMPNRAGKLNKTPIFLTANHAERIYQPLTRFGRTDVFYWKPTLEERESLIRAILGIRNKDSQIPRLLAKEFEDKPISFFSHIAATARLDVILQEKKDWDTKSLIANSQALSAMRDRCNKVMESTDWFSVARSAAADNY